MPKPAIRTMTGFRRFLQRPGARVTPIRHDLFTRLGLENDPWATEPRRVAEVTDRHVKFTLGRGALSFLKLTEPARFTFQGDRVAYNPAGALLVVFRLSVEAGRP